MVTSVQNSNGPATTPQVANAGSPQPKPQQNVSTIGSGSGEKVSISHAAGIQSSRDQSVQAGKLVNQTDQTLAKQQRLLSQMHEKLQGIVKQFPPYWMEDSRRVALLKSISGIKKEIEALEFPKDAASERKMPQGVTLPNQGNGLQLPDLNGVSASDQQVAEAAKQVQATLGQVTGQRRTLARSVHQSLGGSAYSSLVRKIA